MRGASAASCSCAAQPRPCRRAVPARHWTHRPSHSRAAFASRPGAATLRSMNTTRLSLLTIAAALALAGCGNKGPLVLPDAPEEEAPVVVDETDTAATPAAGGAEAAPDEDTTDGGAIDDTTAIGRAA